jgi:hypothetical protein
VLGRNESDLDVVGDATTIPPVAAGKTRTGNRSAHNGVVAERREDDRIVTPDKAGQGGDVKVVVVVVAEENDVDRRQVVKGDGRRRDSSWTREG